MSAFAAATGSSVTTLRIFSVRPGLATLAEEIDGKTHFGDMMIMMSRLRRSANAPAKLKIPIFSMKRCEKKSKLFEAYNEAYIMSRSTAVWPIDVVLFG